MDSAPPNSNPERLVDDLHRRLAAMHGQWRKALFWRAAARMSMAGMLGLLALGVLDALFQLPFRLRLGLCLASVVVWLGFAWQTWLRYWLRPYSATSMAWVLESVFPEFHERLVSAVELADRRRRHRGISEKLICETLSEARSGVDSLSPSAVFPMRWRVLKAPLLMVAAGLLLMALPGLELPRRIGRVAMPSPRDASLGTVRLELSPGSLIRNEGDAPVVRARGRGRLPAEVELLVRETPARHEAQTRRFVMREGPKGWFHYELPAVEDDFWLWAQAGRVRSQSHLIRVRKRPLAERFSLVHRYPDYTHLAAGQKLADTGAIHALQGTRVEVVLVATQALQRCVVILDGRRLPVRIAPSGREASFTIPVLADGAYSVELTNQMGLLNRGELVYDVKAIPDLPPEVALLAPLSDVHVETGQGVELRWLAGDDFGLASQAIHLTLASGRHLATIELGANERARTVVPSDYGFGFGQELTVAVSVADHAGQETRSPPQSIFLGGGELLAKLDGYLRTCRQLLAIFNRLDGDLDAVQTYARHLEVHGDPSAAEPHYRLMSTRKLSQIGEGLKTIQSMTLELKDGATFPRAASGAERVRLYGEQELLFSIPEWDRGETEIASIRLRKMFRLGREMCLALQEKAERQRRFVDLQRNQTALAAMAEDDAPPAARLSLLIEKLADADPQWADQLPPHENLTGDAATLADARQTLGDILARMVAEAEAAFADNRRLDQAAAAIDGELRGLENQLRKLADQLRRDGGEERWREARELARNYSAIAARETDPGRRADAEGVAEVIERAAEDRRPDLFDAAAEALAAFRSAPRVRQAGDGLAGDGLAGDGLAGGDEPPAGDRRRAAADTMRTRLANLGRQPSDTIARAANLLAQSAVDIRLPEAVLSEIATALNDAQKLLAERARKFRDEATRDLLVARGLPSLVMEKLVLALALDAVRTGDLDEARGILAQTAAGFADAARRSAHFALSHAADRLADGSRRLQAIAELAQRHEMASAGGLSPNEMARLHAAIDQLFGPLLPDRLRDPLLDVDLFSTFEEAVTGLSSRAAASDLSPSAIAGLAESLPARLAESLPEVMVSTRQATIDRSLVQVAELRDRLLALKVAAGTGEAASERGRLATDVDQRRSDLARELSRVDAANALLDVLSPKVAPRFISTTLPLIGKGVQEAQAGRRANPALDEAGPQLAALRATLTEMLKRPTVAFAVADQAVNDPQIPLPARQTMTELEKVLLSGEQLQLALQDPTWPSPNGWLATDGRDEADAPRRRLEDSRLLAAELSRRLVDELGTPADESKPPLGPPLGFALVKLRQHVAAGDFALALRNLDAIRAGLREVPEPRRHAERPPFDGERPPAPELVGNALAGLDLNALKGVALEMAREYPDGAFAGNPAAVVAAVAGNYRQAAALASGLAARQLDMAAHRREHLDQGPPMVTPARFAVPRDPVADPLPDERGAIARPPPVPLNDAAYAAVAMAGELRNREALGYAEVGDYRSAAESMTAFARAVDSPDVASLADLAARQFRQALEEAREAMPGDLRAAWDLFQTVVDQQPPPPDADDDCQAALTVAWVATSIGDYRRAAVGLERSLLRSEWRAWPEVRDLAERLGAADREWQRRAARLPATARLALASLRQPPGDYGPLPLSQANKAVTAIIQRDYSTAVERLRVAREATANPLVLRHLWQNIVWLELAEARDWGALSWPVRRLLREMDDEMSADVQTLIGQEQLALAETLARERGEDAVANRLAKINQARLRGLPAPAEHALRTVANLAKRELLSLDRRILAEALDLAANEQFDAAANALRRAAGSLVQAAELAWEIDSVEMETNLYLQAMEGGVENSRAGDFGRALERVNRLGDPNAVPGELMAALHRGQFLQRSTARLAYAEAWRATSPAGAGAFIGIGDALLTGDLPKARESMAKVDAPPPALTVALDEMEALGKRAENGFRNLRQAVAYELLEHIATLALRARYAGHLAVPTWADAAQFPPADVEAMVGEIMARVAEWLAAGDLAGAREELAALPRELPTVIAAANRLQAQSPVRPGEISSPWRPVSAAGAVGGEGLLHLALAATAGQETASATGFSSGEHLREAQKALRRATAMAVSRAAESLSGEPSAESPEAGAGIALPQPGMPPDFATWQGVDSQLTPRGPPGAARDYDDTYYREANQAYLEQIARESQRWSD